MSGWIQLHRKLIDNPVFKNHKLLQTFLYCLLKASHSEREILVGDSIVRVLPGQLVTGRKAISMATGLTEQNIRTALSKLETLSILTINPTSKYSIISISNWNQYQQTNQQVTSCQPTSNQQVTTNNNYNNYNNGKKKDMSTHEASTEPKVPYEKIKDLYHELLPNHPRVNVITEKRKGHIRQSWKNYLGSLDDWQEYFTEGIQSSDFLSGRVVPTNGRRPFIADFDWLINQNNIIKVSEGKYHG